MYYKIFWPIYIGNILNKIGIKFIDAQKLKIR